MTAPETGMPEWFSAHGEGYCSTCHFIEPLIPYGISLVISPHNRANNITFTASVRCEGSYRLPPKRTPVTSRKAAFTAKAPKITCRVCGEKVDGLADGRAGQHSRPTTPDGARSAICSGSWQTGR